MPFTDKQNALFDGIYDTCNSVHREMVLRKTQALEKAYKTLNGNDQYACGGGLLTVAGVVLSFVPLVPFTMVAAIAGACVGAWYTKGRSELAEDYQSALDEAVMVYQWCFEGTDTYQVLRYPELQKLTLLLAPLLSKNDWQHWDDEALSVLARDESMKDKMTRGAEHMARQAVSSMWQKGLSIVGLSEEVKEVDLSDGPASKEENAIFVASLREASKGGSLATFNRKVYGHNQSLNPFTMLPSLSTEVKDKIVEKGMEVATDMMAKKT
jgi:hypothetical protein